MQTLSDLEWKIGELVAKGYSIERISEELASSPKTIYSQVHVIALKLGWKTGFEKLSWILIWYNKNREFKRGIPEPKPCNIRVIRETS